MKRKSYSRKRRRRRYRNPALVGGLLAKPRQMFRQDFLMDAAGIAAGFMLPTMGIGFLPVQFRDTPFKYYASKIGVIAGISTLAGAVSKRASRTVLMGGVVSLMLDAWTEIRSRTGAGGPAPEAAPEGTGYWYGDRAGAGGMGYWYGEGDDSEGEIGS